jgi:hypothetical protein
MESAAALRGGFLKMMRSGIAASVAIINSL